MSAHDCQRYRRTDPRNRRWRGVVIFVVVFSSVAGSATAAVFASMGAYSRAGSLTPGVWHSSISPLAAPAKAPARGVNYGGTTSRQDPFVLVLSKDGKRITRITEAWNAPCKSGMVYPFTNNVASSLSITSSGAFKGARSGSLQEPSGITGQLQESVTGKVKGKKISGSLTAHVDMVDQAGAVVDTCDLSTRLALTSAKGTEFAGATSKGAPAVLELTRNRQKVNHFHIAWNAVCTPQGFGQFGEFLRNFPIKKGRFGDSWKSSYTDPTDPSAAFSTQEFSARGKIKGARASGSFHTEITFQNVTGAAVATCDSGSLSWRASSG